MSRYAWGTAAGNQPSEEGVWLMASNENAVLRPAYCKAILGEAHLSVCVQKIHLGCRKNVGQADAEAQQLLRCQVE